MRAQQPRLQQRQRDDDREAEPVDRARRIDLVAEQRKRRNAGDAHRAAGQALPVEDDEADDLADRERRDGDIMAAQAEGGKDEQRCRGRARDQARDGHRRTTAARRDRSPAAPRRSRRSPAVPAWPNEICPAVPRYQRQAQREQAREPSVGRGSAADRARRSTSGSAKAATASAQTTSAGRATARLGAMKEPVSGSASTRRAPAEQAVGQPEQEEISSTKAKRLR